MNEFLNRLIKIDPAILHFVSLYAGDGSDGHLALFHKGIQQVSGFRSYIIFRPQVLGWPEIIWSVTLLGINLVRWVIFDSVSFIFLWRRYASKSQKGETKLSVSSPFTQNVYSIKINFSWLSDWDAFKTWFLASSKVEPACYKQSQLYPKTVGVHLSRPRKLLRIHFQQTD